MVIRWTEEEKVLLNMKIMIAAGWRMNSQQLSFYCEKLEKSRSRILPGQLGDMFLKKMEWIVEQDAETKGKAWSYLMQDTEQLLEFIRGHSALNEKDWLKMLPKLEAQREKYFRTELGTAFILCIREKLDDRKELEKIAIWMTEDTGRQSAIHEQKTGGLYSDRFRKAAVVALTCLSACFMCVWMSGQVARYTDQQNLQQMKVSAMVDVNKQRNLPAQPVKRIEIQPDAQIASKPEQLPQYREMSKEYPHLYGWLQIPQTQIDLPVMRAEGDRDFYLKHDFSGEKSAEGALFVDEKNSIYPQDGNTVVYGHNMKNGHMFGMLKLYTNESFFQEHKEICFDTIYEAGIYEAVAVLKTRILNENEQGFRYYQFFQYQNEAEFQECLDFVEENRIFETGGNLQYGDHILMLSTCEYSQENGRLVIVARKLN